MNPDTLDTDFEPIYLNEEDEQNSCLVLCNGAGAGRLGFLQGQLHVAGLGNHWKDVCFYRSVAIQLGL